MKKAKLLLLTLLAVLGYSNVLAETVSPYTVDFNTNPGVGSSHDWAVAAGWDHVVATNNYDGYGPYYMTYGYAEDEGIGGSGTLKAYRQYAGDYGGGAVANDILVTPKVSGTITLFVKDISTGSYPSFVEIYAMGDNGSTVGELLHSFDADSYVASETYEGWSSISFELSAEQRIGIRAQYASLDNFSATSASIEAIAKLNFKSVTKTADQGSSVYFNQQEDGSLLARFLVTLTNTGTVDLVAGVTENYSFNLFARSWSSGSNLFKIDNAFDVPVDLAAGETSEPFEVGITIPAEQVALLPSNNWAYWYLEENISNTIAPYLYAGIKKYESKFIFDKEGTSYSSNPSSTSTVMEFGKITENTTLNYEIYNPGTAPLTINSITIPSPFVANAPNGEFTVAAGEKKVISFTLPADNTGIFTGNLEIVYTNALSTTPITYTLGMSGTVLDASKNLITFDDGSGNASYPQGSVRYNVYITYDGSGDNKNYYVRNATGNNPLYITPLMSAEAGETFAFDAKAISYSGSKVEVKISKDRQNWETIQTVNVESTSNWTTYSVQIPEVGDYYIGFVLTSSYIDNIYGLVYAETPEHDLLIVSSNIPTTGTQNADYTATVNVGNVGPNVENAGEYTATLYVGGAAVATSNEVNLPVAVISGNYNNGEEENYTTLPFTFKPHTVGTLPAYIELKAGDTVVKTDEVEVTIAEEVATSDAIEVGSGSTTSYSYAPIDFFNFEQQRTSDIVYTAEQLAKFGIKAGDNISTLAFKGTCSAKSLTKSSLKAWVGLSTGDITYGTPNKDEMTEVTVYNPGDMVFTSGTNWVTINLPSPIVYDGTSDLRIYLEGGGNGEYISFNFAYDTNYSNMKWSNATSLKYNPLLYVTLLVETPKLFGAVNDISGKTQEAPLPLAGVKVTIRSSVDDVEYTGVTDENGNYCIDIVQKELTYDEFFCELDGYATESYTERSGKNVTFNSDCDLWIEDYPFIGDETITGCSYNFGMYPCVELTISESTWATFYYERDSYMVPEGLTAYTAVKEGNEIVLSDRGLYIPAACPVVINGEPGTYQFKWTDTSYSYTGDNDLIGSEEGGTFGPDGAKYYVLSWKNKNKNVEEVGFYYLQGSKGAYAKVKAHQAYMKVPSSQANEAGYTFVINDGTTGISAVEAEDSVLDLNQPMYNLAGQRVGKDYRGVVIQNGKKTIKK